VRDQDRFRRFKTGCPYYRENWVVACEQAVADGGEIVLYEIYCLRDLPPVTQEDQDKCLRSRYGCWRLSKNLKPPTRPCDHPETAWPAAAGQPAR
jgi:hypothetical protein